MVALSGKGWKLAPSLVQLMAEVDRTWPNRKKDSDGSIGDLAHSVRSSEHNPDDDPDGMPRGYVSAVDITKDSVAMIETIRLALIKDPRVWYVIHDGWIYSRTYKFAKRKYTGENPHKGHLHVSLMQTALAANDVRSWNLVRAALSYTVRAGDTLSAIAVRFKTTVAALVKRNGIKDPNRINVGDKIKVEDQ